MDATERLAVAVEQLAAELVTVRERADADRRVGELRAIAAERASRRDDDSDSSWPLVLLLAALATFFLVRWANSEEASA